jgi:hypothetical protein
MNLPPVQNVAEQDALTQFLYWFVRQPIAMLKPPEVPGVITVHESVLTITIFKAPPFQVELVILLPNSPAWPGEHRHPNVDSYEVAWFNSLDFIKNGKICNGPELVIPVPVEGGFTVPAFCVRLRPTDWHGTKPLPMGAALISVQHWLNGVEPTSVGNDWIGEPTTPGHAKILAERGNSAEK